MNFNQPLSSPRQACISFVLGLFVLPFAFAMDDHVTYPLLLGVVMILLSATADVLPQSRERLARGLRRAAFVVTIMTFVLGCILMMNAFLKIVV